MRLAHHSWPLKVLLVFLCATPLLLFARYASAQQTSQPWWNQSTLTGDWGGLRTRLKETGITFNAHYTSESAGIVAGGPRHTARYTQQLDLETLFDLDRLAGVRNALVRFTLTYRSGRSLSNDVLHNQFSVQELYGAGQNFRLAELNFQQDLDDQKVHYEIGWSPVGDDFARLPDFCKFQNGVICGHANAMTTRQRRPQLSDCVVRRTRQGACHPRVLRCDRCVPGQAEGGECQPGFQSQLQEHRRVRTDRTRLAYRWQRAAGRLRCADHAMAEAAAQLAICDPSRRYRIHPGHVGCRPVHEGHLLTTASCFFGANADSVLTVAYRPHLLFDPCKDLSVAWCGSHRRGRLGSQSIPRMGTGRRDVRFVDGFEPVLITASLNAVSVRG